MQYSSGEPRTTGRSESGNRLNLNKMCASKHTDKEDRKKENVQNTPLHATALPASQPRQLLVQTTLSGAVCAQALTAGPPAMFVGMLVFLKDTVLQILLRDENYVLKSTTSSCSAVVASSHG